MDRREFATQLGHGVMGLTGVGALSAFAGCSQQAGDQDGELLDVIGLQLYTVRDLMQQNVRDTLVEIARIGYKEVEFAGYFGQSAEGLRELLDGLGITAPAAHVSLDGLRGDLEGVLASAQRLGHQYLVVPSLPAPDRTPDGFRRVADELNAIGETVRNGGLTLGYHNHAFEFGEIDGQIGYDILLDNCQPELVAMEIDLFWITAAGRDPREYFTKYPGRFPLCHIKDRDESGNMVDVGEGSMDFRELLTAGRPAGLQHFFVEHDRPGDALASVAASYNYLSRLSL